MAKEMIKAAGRAAIEKTLEQLIPTMLNRFDDIQRQLNEFRRDMDKRFERIDEKFERIDEKFERNQELFNEQGLRINTLAAKLDAFLEIVREDRANAHSYLERLVRVEEGLKSRRRRAG
jgi:archaellum component FlaC